MVFSRWTYIVFLSIVVFLYWNCPKKFRIWLLLLASYFFYMSWSPPFGLIYGPVIFLDSLYFYWLSRLMVKHPENKKKILVFGIVTELLLLAYFKYTNFLLGTMESLLTWANLPSFHLEVNIFLPLAISFTNFILIAYLVDVYRGEEKPHPQFTHFATYVAFFPHLIAGPIVRASELQRQFDSDPAFERPRFFKGIHLFWVGFAMKVMVADQLGHYVNLIYGDAALQGFDTSWVATYAFAIQIFTDFWGYTLMAQGSALMLGYTLPDNFNAPYFALNITDFWRRWHMSLSRWLKDYLYIPLGGSRHGRAMTYRNLFITMGLGGLWHGASWNFVIWGLLHGMYLTVHKAACYLNINRYFPTLAAWFVTFHAVCLAWVFFRARTFDTAWHMIQQMLNPATMLGLRDAAAMNINGWIALGLVVLFFAVHGISRLGKDWFTRHPRAYTWTQGGAYALLMYGIITVYMYGILQDFIYFQF